MRNENWNEQYYFIFYKFISINLLELVIFYKHVAQILYGRNIFKDSMQWIKFSIDSFINIFPYYVYYFCDTKNLKQKKKRIRYSLFEFLKHGYNYNFTVDKGERERREKATIDLFSNF